MITVLLVVIGGLSFFYKSITAPAQGRVVTNAQSAALLKKNQPIRVEAAPLPASSSSNPYYSLQLPAGFRQSSATANVPGLLYQESLLKPAISGSQSIAIALKQMPAGGLAEDASYQSRVRQPERYRMSQLPTKNTTLTVSQDVQSGPTTGFWNHGDYLVTIAVSSGIADVDTQTIDSQLRTLKQIVNGWQWQ